MLGARFAELLTRRRPVSADELKAGAPVASGSNGPFSGLRLVRVSCFVAETVLVQNDFLLRRCVPTTGLAGSQGLVLLALA
jgi:hypothetical protein